MEKGVLSKVRDISKENDNERVGISGAGIGANDVVGIDTGASAGAVFVTRCVSILVGTVHGVVMGDIACSSAGTGGKVFAFADLIYISKYGVCSGAYTVPIITDSDDTCIGNGGTGRIGGDIAVFTIGNDVIYASWVLFQ